MSMPQEEGVQSPNPLTNRVAGLPVIVWVGIIALVALWWFSRKKGGGLFGGSGAGGSVTTSGGGGSASAGRTTIDKGAVQITVTQGTQKQPGPPVRKKRSMETVPEVIGMNWPEAEAKVKRAHLTPERTRPYVGATTNESPDAGKKVKKGSVVKLTGSDRPE